VSSKRRYVLKNPKRIFHLIGIFLLYLSLLFCRGQWRIGQLQREASQKRKEIVQLTEYNTQLRRKIENLQSDSYVEEVARAELGFVKKGEILYRFAEAEGGKLEPFQPIAQSGE